MKRIYWLLVSTFFGAVAATAQQDGVQKALQAMQTLSRVYQQSKLLSFDITYTYSTEADPQKPLDSLKGECKMNGSKYWSRMDETESIYNNDLLAILFKEDNMIYLARPTVAQKAAANPIALLDSFFLKSTGYTYATTETKKELVVTISMPEGQSTKKASYYINRQTGYLTRVSSLVRSDQLYDPSVQNLVKDAASMYVVVNTVYSNYKQGAFDESVFDIGRYIKKEDSAYVAVAPYEQYKVFIGSSGL